MMMKQSLSFIFSLAIFCLPFCEQNLYAQTLPADSISIELDSVLVAAPHDVVQDVVPEDSTKVIYPLLSGLSILVDYGKLLTYWTNFESKSELGIQLQIKGKVLVSAELGHAVLNPQNAYSNASYESRGTFYRLGLDYSVALNQKSNLSLGVRYAQSFYEDDAVVKISTGSALHDDLETPFARSGLSAHWYEFVFGTESQMKPRLYLGAFLRLRIMDKYDEQAPIDTYAIPGYGRTFDDSVPALNLYIRYQFLGKKL